MSGEKQYTANMFLAVIDTTIPCSTSYISQQIGCTRDTTKLNLQFLELSGKIQKFEVRGLRNDLWIRV